MLRKVIVIKMEKLIGNRKLLPLFTLICALLWGCGFSVTKTGYALFAIETAGIASKVLFAGVRFMLAGVLTLGCYLAENKKLDPGSVGRNIGGISLLALFQTVIQCSECLFRAYCSVRAYSRHVLCSRCLRSRAE